MSVMRERFILERTVTAENGRTVLQERKIYGVLDAGGTFHLRGYREKRFSIRQDKNAPKNKKTAA